MRDVVIILLVFAGSAVAIARPWIGVMVWTWLSIMSPHRFAWGMAYDAPLAAIVAGSTAVGLLLTRDRELPFKGGAVYALVLFMAWVTLTWAVGMDPRGDYEQWKKVMKIDVMILVALALLHSKQHIFALAWVVAGSLALLGIKSGIFTIVTGGHFRVWGPPGSFIEDNNDFALALVLTIPLLRFLQLQLCGFVARHCMTGAMLLCATAALGTYSRGSFLGMLGMALALWWRSRNRFVGGFVIVVSAIALVSLMPDMWMDRMGTITTYQEDSSALGRISAWWNAWNIGLNRPFGVGFDAARPELFALYSPYPDRVHAAHSIYFQVLGNHGFIGLALFVAIGVATWRSANWLRAEGTKLPQTKWCADLATMCQVSLAGYAIGGAFLSLSYFDLPYNIMVLVVLTRVWVQTRGWEHEPVYAAGWRTIPGLRVVTKDS